MLAARHAVHHLQNWLLPKSSSKTGAATITPATAAATNTAAWCSLAAVDLIQASTTPYTLCSEEAAATLLFPPAVCHNLRLPPLLLLLLLLGFFTTLVLHFNSILLSLQHFYSISQAHQEGSVSPQKLPHKKKKKKKEEDEVLLCSGTPIFVFVWGCGRKGKPAMTPLLCTEFFFLKDKKHTIQQQLVLAGEEYIYSFL
jgi:hypothetical protein